MINKINLINLLKIAFKFKKEKIKFKLNKNDFSILQLLINLNIIKYIKKEKNNIYFLFLNLNFLNLKIKNFYKPTKKLIIKHKQLKLINFKKKNIFIISTPKGLISNVNAQKLNQGGLIILSLNL